VHLFIVWETDAIRSEQANHLIEIGFDVLDFKIADGFHKA
jgi:hypothetical protein